MHAASHRLPDRSRTSWSALRPRRPVQAPGERHPSEPHSSRASHTTYRSAALARRRSRLRTSDAFLRRSKEQTVRYVFNDEGVSVESDLAKSEIKWALFDEILKFKDLWLLIYSRSGYMTLPTSDMTEECKLFIEQKILSPKKIV